jgi:hypothetical protein
MVGIIPTNQDLFRKKETLQAAHYWTGKENPKLSIPGVTEWYSKFTISTYKKKTS